MDCLCSILAVYFIIISFLLLGGTGEHHILQSAGGGPAVPDRPARHKDVQGGAANDRVPPVCARATHGQSPESHPEICRQEEVILLCNFKRHEIFDFNLSTLFITGRS